jgi:Glycosyltransferase like family 2
LLSRLRRELVLTRPAVTVVMPFAGSRADAERALDALLEIGTGPDDELILSDNAGLAPQRDGVLVVAAASERSPSHARNVGAERATRDWVLFLDADCRAEPGLIESYFEQPIAPDIGALAGEVIAATDGTSLAARYGAARNFLGQSAHLSHSYLPRAVAANLLVRRSAFEQVGGFYEGVRAAEDTDFSWRLQRAGWVLEARPRARVVHQYRTSVDALRRQWRGYAAGRAWLGRRYEDFDPEPALQRAGGRLLRRRSSRRRRARGRPERRAPYVRRTDRGRFLALDALLGVEELAGLALSNRPPAARGERPPVQVVLVAEHFSARGDPLSDFARTLAGARVEAVARPEAFDPRAARELVVDYREDDGAAARLTALVRLFVRHPLRSALDPIRRRRGDARLAVLAPAALRLIGDPGARVYALGGNEARETARRLATLAGRTLEDA